MVMFNYGLFGVHMFILKFSITSNTQTVFYFQMQVEISTCICNISVSSSRSYNLNLPHQQLTRFSQKVDICMTIKILRSVCEVHLSNSASALKRPVNSVYLFLNWVY